MEFRSNLHTHTQFSDGKDTMEEMVGEAIRRNFVSLGFSDHSVTADFDEGVHANEMDAYFAEIARMKEKYKDQLDIYTGIEWDYHSNSLDKKSCSFDYVIGSVHDVKIDGTLYSVDYKPDSLEKAIELLGGKSQKLWELYYETVLIMAENCKPTIIGHLDLPKKLNKQNPFFDEQASWYEKLSLETVEILSKQGVILEINTGGMARGYRQDPYPSNIMIKKAIQLGTPLTLSSDCHDRNFLTYAFEETIERLKELGCRSVVQKRKNQWIEVPLD